jgi:manganese efflux pump family protein
MAVAALGSWILTAGWGVYLLSRWLPGGVFGGRWALLPGRLIYGHILLATAGLGAWVWYVYTESYRVGWASVLAISMVAAIGYVRFVQWLPKYGQHAARERVPGSPAARDFPYGAVLLHGMWAAVTLVLVLVTVLTRR